MGRLEYPGSAGLMDLDGVLQGVDRFHVLGIARVDQRPHSSDDVARADPFLRQSVVSAAVDDLGRVLVLVDDLH